MQTVPVKSLSCSPIQGTSCSCWEVSECQQLGTSCAWAGETCVNISALGLVFRRYWGKWFISVLSADAERALLRLAFITDTFLWGLTYWKIPGNWIVGGTCSPRSGISWSWAGSCAIPHSMREWDPQAWPSWRHGLALVKFDGRSCSLYTNGS